MKNGAPGLIPYIMYLIIKERKISGPRRVDVHSGDEGDGDNVGVNGCGRRCRALIRTQTKLPRFLWLIRRVNNSLGK